MRRVEYPGCSNTNVCAAGVTGCFNPQKSHPPAASPAIRTKMTKKRTVNILDESASAGPGHWSCVNSYAYRGEQTTNKVFHVEHSVTLLGAFCIHPALQNQHRGHLVYDLAAALDGHFSFAKQAIGLGRAEALVPEMDWQLEALPELFGEALHLLGLNAFGSAHSQGVADDHLDDFVFANHIFQLREV